MSYRPGRSRRQSQPAQGFSRSDEIQPQCDWFHGSGPIWRQAPRPGGDGTIQLLFGKRSREASEASRESRTRCRLVVHSHYLRMVWIPYVPSHSESLYFSRRKFAPKRVSNSLSIKIGRRFRSQYESKNHAHDRAQGVRRRRGSMSSEEIREAFSRSLARKQKHSCRRRCLCFGARQVSKVGLSLPENHLCHSFPDRERALSAQSLRS
jgi:hypothetical protein